MDRFARKMDIAKILENSGYVNLISNVMMEPYQTKILSQFKSKDHGRIDVANTLKLDEALHMLEENVKHQIGSDLSRKLDRFISSMFSGIEQRGPEILEISDSSRAPRNDEVESGVLLCRSEVKNTEKHRFIEERDDQDLR
jgi:hypothetical protein